MDRLFPGGEASPALQLLFLTLIGLGALAILVLLLYVGWLRRLVRTHDLDITALQAGRAQNAERIQGLTTAVERLAKHHHIGASMGADTSAEGDVSVIIEEAVDSSIPWVNPVPLLQDNPDLLREIDLPLDRFASPAPITDPNLRAVTTAGGRALPPVPPDPRRLRQYVAPARSITSEPITAVDAPVIVPPADEPPRAPRHAAPDIGRHAAR